MYVYNTLSRFINLTNKNFKADWYNIYIFYVNRSVKITKPFSDMLE